MKFSILNNLLLLKRAIVASCWRVSSITSFYKFDVIVKSKTFGAVEFFFSRRISSLHSDMLITDLYFQMYCAVHFGYLMSLRRRNVPILSLKAVYDLNLLSLNRPIRFQHTIHERSFLFITESNV